MAINKKAITPIISVILILMMVVAVAGGMFFWLTRVQGQQQGGIESFQGKFFTTAATQAHVVKATYNDSSQIVNLFVQNIGNNPIPVDNGSTYPTTEWIIFDSNQRSVCSSNWFYGYPTSNNTVACLRGCNADIPVGQIRQININLTNSICSIGSLANGSRVSFTIDFSGKTTAGGSFDK